MQNSSLEARLGRLERLERDRASTHRVWVCVVILGLAGGVCGAAAVVPDVLRTQRLEIVDQEGRLAAVIQSHANGGGILSLYDRGGNRLAVITAADGGQLSIASAAGNELVRLGDGAQRGGGIIEVRRPKGSVAVQIAVDGRDRGYVGVFNDVGMGRTLEPQASDALGSRVAAH